MILHFFRSLSMISCIPLSTVWWMCSRCVTIYLSNLDELWNFHDQISKDLNARKCWKVWKQINNHFPIEITCNRSKIILNRYLNIPIIISEPSNRFSASCKTIRWQATDNHNFFLTISYFYNSKHCLERSFFISISFWSSQWRTQKFLMWGGLIQWHMVVICIWCALFVTSRFDVIVMFPNQHFGEVCWHNMYIFLHPLPLIYVSLYGI